jgi:ribosomal protein S18 acetylase RimI-like enzyme
MDTEYVVVKQLFLSLFYSTDEFRRVWTSRCKEASLGLFLHGGLIGFALVRGHKLEYICIDESHQNNGWGSVLLQKVLLQCPNLYLIPVENPAVCRWYEKQGFHLENSAARRYVRHTHQLRNA